jgi:hypothetical protein
VAGGGVPAAVRPVATRLPQAGGQAAGPGRGPLQNLLHKESYPALLVRFNLLFRKIPYLCKTNEKLMKNKNLRVGFSRNIVNILIENFLLVKEPKKGKHKTFSYLAYMPC